MRKREKRFLSLLLSTLLITMTFCSVTMNVFAISDGVPDANGVNDHDTIFELRDSNDVVLPYKDGCYEIPYSKEPQDIIFVARWNKPAMITSWGGGLIYPTGAGIKAIYNREVDFPASDVNLQNGYFLHLAEDSENHLYQQIVDEIITIPAKFSSGEYEFGLKDLVFSHWSEIYENFETTFSDETITLKILPDPDAPCTHDDPVFVSAIEPSCNTPGNIDYWYCENCKKYFTDSDCTTEISLNETVILCTPHSFEDGVCTVCGAHEDDSTFSYEIKIFDTDIGKDVTSEPLTKGHLLKATLYLTNNKIKDNETYDLHSFELTMTCSSIGVDISSFENYVNEMNFNVSNLTGKTYILRNIYFGFDDFVTLRKTTKLSSFFITLEDDADASNPFYESGNRLTLDGDSTGYFIQGSAPVLTTKASYQSSLANCNLSGDDKTITVDASAINNTNADKNVIGLLAAYDANGKMLGSCMQEYLVSGESEAVKQMTLQLKQSVNQNDTKLVFYLLDNSVTSKYSPLCDSFEAPINSL